MSDYDDYHGDYNYASREYVDFEDDIGRELEQAFEDDLEQDLERAFEDEREIADFGYKDIGRVRFIDMDAMVFETGITKSELENESYQHIYRRLMGQRISNIVRFNVLVKIFVSRFENILKFSESDVNEIMARADRINEDKLINMNALCFIFGYFVFKGGEENIEDNLELLFRGSNVTVDHLIEEPDVYRYYRYFLLNQ